MRVTKLVREYIEREVNNKFNQQDKELKALTEKYDKIQVDFEKDIKKVQAKADKEIEKLIEKYGYKETRRYHVEISTYGLRNPYYDELNDKKKALKEIKRNKIDEILINLELGGTRADLDKALNDITI